MKESYEKATVEIIRFEIGADVITTSPGGDTPLPETGE